MLFRVILFWILLLVFGQLSKAQLHDRNWLMGYAGTAGFPWGINQMVFNMDSFETNLQTWNVGFGKTNACMSDSSGNFLFASNGAIVINAMGDTMENGDSLSPCMYTEDFAEYGLDINQGALSLPYPGHPGWYVLFHEKIPYAIPDQAFEWNYSLIDMNANNGLGKVISKNLILVSDTMLAVGNVTAVKHANGRDWWILKATRLSNKLYRVLLSSEGISNLIQVGTSESESHDIRGTSSSWIAFSPDGRRLAQLLQSGLAAGGIERFLKIVDFDRCDGSFSNSSFLNITNFNSYIGPGSISFSPNSSFLYLSYIRYLFQFDLEAPDILASMDTVAIFDGTGDPQCINCLRSFYILQPAPDGKIYCSAANSITSMHVINHPNVKGDCCDFRQHAINLPAFYYCGLPNFPYYRVGPVDGSSCDTLGLDNIFAPDTTDASYVCDSSLLVSNGLKYPPIVNIYPNPASDWVQVASNARKGLEYSACLFSLTGEKVMELALEKMNTSLDVSLLPNGIYMVEISNKLNQTKVLRKLSVVH